MNVKFEVRAVEPEQLQVSRRGISFRQGGRVVATEVFEFPHTPYYLAEEIVRDEHPGCKIVLKAL